MSLKTVISSNEALIKAFKQAQKNPDFGFLKITIDLEKNEFELKNEEQSQGDEVKDWEKISTQLEEGKHSYFVVKDPEYERMFVLMHWAPDQSSIKQKMVYASSRATLKGFLGQSLFSSDYYVSTREDCNVKRLKQQRIWNDESAMATDVNMQPVSVQSGLDMTAPKFAQAPIIQRLAVEMSPSAQTCVAKLAKNESKLALFKLSEDRTTLLAEEYKDDTLLGIRDLLPDNEPRYFIFWHTRSRKDDKVPRASTVRVFAFYCPENCERALKFSYSTSKHCFVDFCTQAQLTFEGKVELAEKSELNYEFLDYHVFPIFDDKVSFDTPKPPKKKRRPHKKQRKIDVE
ncbi:hypothetical protein RFI_22959 [Reticulomyxa filosa]|uniref:ADF-H domain-containing protein n=1 Tax=Reticulomyxa filosa TaxID=46433 RepID=X6MMW7_RETFI|nr:hypothetical protein RFI_22959 [Reticulomyxa filosa]|eukprot:ETO14410.1 hypothetical protein RFI_22959 [Reticulomyxa filosa]